PGMGAGHAAGTQSFEEYCFFGPWGALTPTGDLILETRAWRERLFSERAEVRSSGVPALFAKPAQWIQNVMFPGMGGMGGGGLALNQLLVQMDGIGEAPFMRQQGIKRLNARPDAMYFSPRRSGQLSRRPPLPT